MPIEKNEILGIEKTIYSNSFDNFYPKILYFPVKICG